MKFSPACVSALLAPVLVTAKLSLEFDERHLAGSDCVCTDGNPEIEESGATFRSLINTCINDVDSCQDGYDDLNCWNTSKVTNMDSAFEQRTEFNKPLECWDTSAVTSMQLMFKNAKAFNGAIDGWDTSAVTTMERMFHSAGAFNGAIDGWNTSAVTTMGYMFHSAKAFNGAIDGWNTSAVTTMAGMFISAEAFNRAIDGWDTSAVIMMYDMFLNAKAFNGAIGGWNTSLVPNMGYMFSGAEAFNGAIDGWNTSQVTNMADMFNGAKAFNEAIDGWNTSLVTNMASMFHEASSFDQSIAEWNTSQVTDMTDMFRQAITFNQSIADGYNTSAVTAMEGMFAFARAFNGAIDGWDTSAVTTMEEMLYGARAFNGAIEGWNTSAVTTMEKMFSLTVAFNGAIGGWDTSAVTTMEKMFDGSEAFNGAIGGWNTSAVTTMESMFKDAHAFNKAIDGWNTSAVTTMNYMFSDAKAFNGAIDGWNTSAVTAIRYMFFNAEAFNGAIDGWDTSAVTTMDGMFYNAGAFNKAIDGWDTSAVTRMASMFYEAGEFNQCLSTWAEKTPDDVVTTNMLSSSGCRDKNDPSPIAGPWCQTPAQGCIVPIPSDVPSQSPSEEKESIDLYELRTVGSGKKPVGQIMTLEPFVGLVYFEAHPSQLNLEKMHVELFAGVEKGEPCDSGELLESTEENLITTNSFSEVGYNEQFEDLDGISYPATSNGIVVAAKFIIGDFRLPNGDKQIYFPDPNPTVEKDGQIKLCVRMALKVDYDGDSNLDYISFLDTYFDVAVDLTANTATFSNNIGYEVLDVTSYLETDVDAIITMKSYICDDENVEVESPVFGSGESFSICVGPEVDVDNNYSVENFIFLICKNEGETRYLVKNYLSDALTTVDSGADEDGVRAVRSVVTPGFFNQDEDEDKFICEGEVLLSYNGVVQGRRRTISKRFHATSPSYNISNNNGNDNRRKDDSSRTLNSEESSSPFQTVVNLSRPSSVPSAGPSSAPSQDPSSKPSTVPSFEPSPMPSRVPSAGPSAGPSQKPSQSPSDVPSSAPSQDPSSKPSTVPSFEPSSRPSSVPSSAPSADPSHVPSSAPSADPSHNPSTVPSSVPSSTPSAGPSAGPSSNPSLVPSSEPSVIPSANPSFMPSQSPSDLPSTMPSSVPTMMPSSTCAAIASISTEFSLEEAQSGFEATASKNAGTKKRRRALQNTNNPEEVETLVETTATATSCKILTEETGVDTVGKQCLVFVTTITAKVSTGVNVQKAVGDIEDAISSGKFASDLETDQGIKATVILPPSEEPSSFPSSSPSTSIEPSFLPSFSPSSLPSAVPSLSNAPSTSPIPSTVPTATVEPSISFAPSSFPSPSPSAVPSFIPSFAPSDAPSSIPSLDPSSAGLSCSNDPDFTYKGNLSKTCDSYVAEKTSKRCKKKVANTGGKRIRDFCPGTCKKKCKTPRGKCENLKTFRFKDKKKFTCDLFVAEKPNKRCKKKVKGGKRIRDFCPGTCKKKCKTPRGKCENLKTFRFKDKKKFTCDLFVAEKPNKRCKKKVKGTKDKVTGKFKKVKFFCPATCKKKC